VDVSDVERLLAASPPEPFVRTMARLADDEPDFVSISCEGDSITRRELERRSNRLARAYAEEGVGLGDYVAITLPNGIEFYVAFFAALKVGAVPLPLSYRLPVVERQAIIDLAGAALLVGVREGEHPGYPALPAGFEPGAAVSDEPLPEVVSPAWKAPTSGGSTGRPKIIRAGSGAEGSPALNQLLYRYSPDDVQAVVAPLYHNSALGMSIGGLLLGQRLVVAKKFDAEELLRLITEHGITWLMLVPTMMHRMYRLIEAGGRYDLSSVRLMIHLAAKCPEWLKEKWIELLGPEKVLEIYGGTESVSITLITGEEWLAHRGSVGRPWFGDMKVLDANGNELPPGEIGEIYMKGPEGAAPTYEYVGAEAKTLNGWETLGDLGWKDEDGYLYISDRRVDMIISGGANIYPAEVENAIRSHPDVADCAVIGVPDERWGEVGRAVVVPRAGATIDPAQLIAFLDGRIARYKIPKSVVVATELPRTASGKVLKSRLRATHGTEDT
jgi:bile acid-coenzyme A ligase